MTQPDQLSPAGQFSPITDLQAKTEADWQNEISAELLSHFSIFELALGSIVNLVLDVFGDIVSGTVTVAQALGNFVAALVAEAIEIPSTVIEFYSDLLTDLASLFTGIGGGSFNIVTGLTNFVSALVSNAIEIPQSVIEAAGWLADAITTSADAVFGTILGLIESLVNGLLSALTGLPIVGGLFSALFSAAASLFTTATDAYDSLPLTGAYAALPTAGVSGREYQCTDIELNLVDTGEAWVPAHIGTGRADMMRAVLTTGWTTTTLNSSTIATDKDARLVTAVSAAGDNIRGEYRALTNSSNYSVTIFVEYGLLPDNQSMGFLMLSDGTKYITVGVGYVSSAMTVFVHKWNTQSSFSVIAYSRTIGNATNGAPQWLRFTDNGTNRIAAVSYNGLDWYSMFSETRTTFLTASNYGYGAYSTNGSNSILRVRSLSEQYSKTLTPAGASMTLTGSAPAIGSETLRPSPVLLTLAGTPLVYGQPTYIASDSAEAAAMTLPSHQYGDVIVMFAYRDGDGTIPSLPTGWTSLQTSSGTNDAARLAYKVAASSAEMSGNWVNATTLLCAVFRGCQVGASNAYNNVGYLVAAPSLTLQASTALVATFVGHRSVDGDFSDALYTSAHPRVLLHEGAIADGAIYVSSLVSSAPNGTVLYSGSSSDYQVTRLELKA